jgi:hypothetical protein
MPSSLHLFNSLMSSSQGSLFIMQCAILSFANLNQVYCSVDHVRGTCRHNKTLGSPSAATGMKRAVAHLSCDLAVWAAGFKSKMILAKNVKV